MLTFTDLERAVLAAICDSDPVNGPAWRDQFAAATVIKRENTGHGFYTSMSVPHAHPPVPIRMHEGAIADMLDMGEGMQMGFILWFEAGYPDCLEGYQYCDSAGNTVDLKTRDLTTLRPSRIKPIQP